MGKPGHGAEKREKHKDGHLSCFTFFSLPAERLVDPQGSGKRVALFVCPRKDQSAMKKIIVLSFLVTLLAAACNKAVTKNGEASQPQKPTQTQAATSTTQTATTTSGSDNFAPEPYTIDSVNKLAAKLAAKNGGNAATPTKATPAPVTEQDFRSQLTALYQEKIGFLDDKIKTWKLTKFAIGLGIDQSNKDISFYNQNCTDTGYCDPYAVKMSQLELDEDTKFSGIWQSRIDQGSQIEQKLNDELTALNADNSTVPQAEYALRQNELNTLVNESDIEQADASINQATYFTADKKAEIDNTILSHAQTAKAWADQQLATINAEAQTAAQNIPPIVTAPITTVPIQPTSIHCNTTADTQMGFPKSETECTEFPTMKTMVCNTSTSGYGSLQKDCYFINQ